MFGPLNADDIRRDGEVPSPEEQLSAAIADLLKKQWVTEDPGERCFDHDETRMAGLLAYVAGQAPRGTADGIRDHLLDWPRCRFIYARVRESMKPPPVLNLGDAAPTVDHVPEAIRCHLRTTGQVVFPDAKVAQGAWEFGNLESLPDEAFEAVCGAIAERAW